MGRVIDADGIQLGYQLDRFKRRQVGLKVSDLFPHNKGYCRCGCGKRVILAHAYGWASVECRRAAMNTFFVLIGDVNIIRGLLRKSCGGKCSCGKRASEVDHIFPVSMGGSACGLDNFQFLCERCHKEKTKAEIPSIKLFNKKCHVEL